MSIPSDLPGRMLNAYIEASANPGQVAMAVVNPDGTDITLNATVTASSHIQVESSTPTVFTNVGYAAGDLNMPISGNQATNNNVSTNGFPVLIAGSDYGGTPKIQSLKVDSLGKQYISVVDSITAITNALPAGTNLLGKVSTDQTTHGTSDLVAADLTKIAGATTSTGNGVVGTGVQRVAIASDNTAFSVNATLSTETTKTIGVVRTADGSGNLLTSTTNALDVNIKSGAIPAGTNSIGTVIPASSATSVANSISRQTALTNTAVAIKGSPGRIKGVHLYNTNTVDIFVQFYDVAVGSVSVGSTTPNWTWVIPAGVSSTIGTPLDIEYTNENAIPATTAISVAATTTVGGGTAPATALLAEFIYI